MELQLRKSILFDVLDGIPPSGNESLTKIILISKRDLAHQY